MEILDKCDNLQREENFPAKKKNKLAMVILEQSYNYFTVRLRLIHQSLEIKFFMLKNFRN